MLTHLKSKLQKWKSINFSFKESKIAAMLSQVQNFDTSEQSHEERVHISLSQPQD